MIASSAPAQTSTPEDVASARVLGTEGVRLAESGDCKAAIPKLDAAERLYHAPTTLERLGECEVKVGQLIAGTEALNRVVRETLAPNAPQAFVTAQQRAAQVFSAAFPRIGKLRIHIDGVPPERVAVSVDGAIVPSALLDADRPTDPGHHDVQATATGYKAAAAAVRVLEGGSSAVALKLEADPSAAAAAAPLPEASGAALQPSAPAATSWTATPPPSGSNASSRVPAYVALGIGGVGLAVGSVFGIMALGTKSTLDNACPSKVCPNSASQSDIDSLSTRATIANIGFGVGIVGLATGAVLLILAPHGDEPRPASARQPRPVQPWVGTGALGLGGTFE